MEINEVAVHRVFPRLTKIEIHFSRAGGPGARVVYVYDEGQSVLHRDYPDIDSALEGIKVTVE